MQMDSRYKLGEIEDIVAEMEELFDIPNELVEGDEEYQIIRCGWWVHIPALDLCLHEGVFLVYDENEQEFMPDFSLTLIRENGQDGWLHYEQDGFVISLTNWLRGRHEISAIEDMECVLCKPKGTE